MLTDLFVLAGILRSGRRTGSLSCWRRVCLGSFARAMCGTALSSEFQAVSVKAVWRLPSFISSLPLRSMLISQLHSCTIAAVVRDDCDADGTRNGRLLPRRV